MDSIESVLRSLYKNKNYGELSSLYRLFSSQLGNAISSELRSKLNRPDADRAFERIYVDFQWIDKIPLASFVNPQTDINGNVISSKTEIGDLFIQYRHNNAFNRNGKLDIHRYCHRSLVVQAKLASNETPIVPVGRISKNSANSTSKELKLLEHWPEFNLYETSASSLPLAKNLSVLKGPVPFAFYGAFANSSNRWFFGVARNGELCKKQFSDVLFDLVSKKAGKDVCDDEAWCRITHEITKSCNNRKIPKSISERVEPRSKALDVHSGNLYSFPSPLFSSLNYFIEKIISIFSGKKMLVLLIDRVSYEGKEMDRYR